MSYAEMVNYKYDEIHEDKGGINLSEMAGHFIPSNGETCFRSMDGSDVRAWLEKNGVKCIKHFDTGRNGLVITACGYSISTNGWVSKVF